MIATKIIRKNGCEEPYRSDIPLLPGDKIKTFHAPDPSYSRKCSNCGKARLFEYT
jgi:hypothetical protein